MKRETGFQALLAWLIAACAIVLSGCGSGTNGDTSTQPGAADIIVIGKLVGTTSAKAARAAMTPAGNLVPLADPIVVTVEEMPSITATVADDGTFTLRGLPAGTFTLVFTQGGAEIGSLEFEEVAINQQITISIQVVDGEVVLVDEDRRGIGHAGIELEGLVENVVTVNLTGDSTFVIAGRTVIARPGVTAIRKGTTRKTVEDVLVGMRVHVKGTTIVDSTDILAYEIKIQDETTSTGPGTESTMTICHIPPGKPANRHTITIGSSAWPAHQAHGDTEGACAP